MEDAESSAKPRDAQTVEAILHAMGVETYDFRVVNQLLELLYRYISSVLEDARTFSEHADKHCVDAEDIKLAIRSRMNFTFTQPPSRDVTVCLAKERNAIPLPQVDKKAGVALPEPQFQLTSQNYNVVANPRRSFGLVKSPRKSPKRARPSASTPSPKRQRVSPILSSAPIKSPSYSSPTPKKTAPVVVDLDGPDAEPLVSVVGSTIKSPVKPAVMANRKSAGPSNSQAAQVAAQVMKQASPAKSAEKRQPQGALPNVIDLDDDAAIGPTPPD